MTVRDYAWVRSKLLRREEVAFLDVREEAPHAEGHPLFAANFPASRIELDAYTKLPRRDVPIVTFDGGEELAERAAARFVQSGYADVAVFDGGLAAWKASGGEVFIDVNVPSKAFGELMEATCRTPSFPAQEVEAMIAAGEDLVIVDVRRFDEYRTMCVPTAINVPGADVVLRVPELAASEDTRIIVNCAGRTRSLIGCQSLIHAGLPNPVAALRNGTIGWALAGQTLDFGQSRVFDDPVSEATRSLAKRRARAVADRAGVKRTDRETLARWLRQEGRTTCAFDVRSAAEYEAGHVPGCFSIPGGQLVQETEMYCPVRGARIALTDDDGVRANMSASWLAQMAWEVYVVDGLRESDFCEAGAWSPPLPPFPPSHEVSPDVARAWLVAGGAVAVDVSTFSEFRKGHVAGAWYALRSRLSDDAAKLPRAPRYVVTSSDGRLARFAAPELAASVEGEVYVLAGGSRAWAAAGHPLEPGETRLASQPIDRYPRPYEGTDAPPEAMQAYLDWEFGLIEQLARDGTHHFQPMPVEDSERS